MKKLLFISNFPRKINNFVIPSIKASEHLGYEFHYAANMKFFKDDAEKYKIKLHHIDLARFPFKLGNIKAYRQLNKLLCEERFDAIHCNTPVGGVLGRFCGKKAKVQKIIYTAHGFHFYEGAPLLNNTLLKWSEMLMAHLTDAIITINHEDYKAACKFKLRNRGKVYYVPGVGIDLKDDKKVGSEGDKLRSELGIKHDDIVLISMGDLIARKNYHISIKAVHKANNEKVKYFICGDGPEFIKIQKLIKENGRKEQIKLLGYRNDIKELLSISDIFLLTSYQEGLPRSTMEAMSFGLPVICSEIRGNTDLIEDGKGGHLCRFDDIDGFAGAINSLSDDFKLRELMGQINLDVIKEYDIENVNEQMLKIYSEVL